VIDKDLVVGSMLLIQRGFFYFYSFWSLFWGI